MNQVTPAFNSSSATWEEHRSAFFKAIDTSDIPTLQTVLTKYPEAVNWQNQRGERPLHLAFKKRDRDTFVYLLQQGANPNQESVIERSWALKILLGPDDPTEYIIDETVTKGAKEFIIPLLQYGAQTYNARRDRAPKEVRYEISDLLNRAEIIRKEFMANQKAASSAKPAQTTPSAAKPTDGQEIEVLKPVKVKKRAGVQTPSA